MIKTPVTSKYGAKGGPVVLDTNGKLLRSRLPNLSVKDLQDGREVVKQDATDDLNLGGNATIQGDLQVAQNAFVIGLLEVTGDLEFAANNKGPVLIDRTTATQYRLKVDNGVLGIEAV